MTQKFASFELLEDDRVHVCIAAEFTDTVRPSNPVVCEPRKPMKKLKASKREQTVEVLKSLDSRAGRGCTKTTIVLSRDTVADNSHALVMAQRLARALADQAELRRWFKSGSKLSFKKWKAREMKLAARQPLPAPPKAKSKKVASGPSHIRATWVKPSPGTRT